MANLFDNSINICTHMDSLNYTNTLYPYITDYISHIHNIITHILSLHQLYDINNVYKWQYTA